MAELERIAAGETPVAAVAAHVESCEHCKDAIESARFAAAFGGVIAGNAGKAVPIDSAAVIAAPAGYRIIREVSRGGQGVVYEAMQEATHRRVALKILRAELGSSTKQVARFEREIEIAAALDHPWIVRVFDSMRMGDGRHAIVMEFVDGLPLDAWARERREQTRGGVHEAVDLLAGVCDAVHYAHQRGVIHRDLKPSNIFVDPSGRGRVLDFGVSTWFGGAGRQEATFTMTGEFSGTLAYAAPEQVSGSGQGADLRSDVYSLGVILYQACFGSLPYVVEGSLESIIRNISNAEPAHPAGARVDKDLWTILDKALAKETDRRYQSAAALGADLRRYRAGEAIEARRSSRWYTLRKGIARHRSAAALGAVLLIALMSIGVVLAVSNSRLDRLFREGSMERARAIAATGNRAEAESIIWPEMLRVVPRRSDALELAVAGDRDQRRALWAYFELQSPRPCLITRDSDNTSRHLTAAGAALPGCVRVLDYDSNIFDVSLRDLSLIRSVLLGESTPFISATITASGSVALWHSASQLRWYSAQTGTMVGSRDVPGRMIFNSKISADGSGATVLDSNGAVLIARVDPSIPIREIIPDSPGLAVAESPSGELVAAVCADGRVRFWNPSTGELAHTTSTILDSSQLPSAPTPSAVTLTLSPGSKLAIIGIGRSLNVVPAADEARPVFTTHTSGGLMAGLVSSSGRWLFTSASRDSVVRVWDTATWNELPPLGGHATDARLTITDDESLVFTSDAEAVMRLWHGPLASWREDLAGSQVNPHDVWIQPDGRRLGVSTSGGMVIDWDRGAGASIPPERFDAKTAFSLDRAGDLTFVGGEAGFVRVKSDGSSVVVAEKFLGSMVNCVRLSPDGTTLAACTEKSHVFLLDAATLAIRVERDLEVARLNMVRWSPDGGQLVVTSKKGNAHVLAASDLSTQARLPVSNAGFARCIAYSPDGRLLATGGDDRSLRFWETASWRKVGECRVADDAIFSVSFHPQGRIVAVGDRSGRVTIVDAAERHVLASFKTPSTIMFVDFFADGSRLVVGSLDQPTQVWDFDQLAKTVDGNRGFWEGKLAATP